MTWSSSAPLSVGSVSTASEMILSASWICSSVMTRGGARRMMFWWVGLAWREH